MSPTIYTYDQTLIIKVWKSHKTEPDVLYKKYYGVLCHVTIKTELWNTLSLHLGQNTRDRLYAATLITVFNNTNHDAECCP